MANKGKRGTECQGLGLCAETARVVRVRVCVLVLGFVFVLCVVFGAGGIRIDVIHTRAIRLTGPRMAPSAGFALEMDRQGPCYRSHPQPKTQTQKSERFENKFGAEWAWNRSPAGGPGYPHGADA